MPEEITVKKVFNNIPEGNSSVGKPRKGWLDDVENYLKKMAVRGWRKKCSDRHAWKLILKVARVLDDRTASGEEEYLFLYSKEHAKGPILSWMNLVDLVF
jgi:hypothetical protein